MCLDHVLFTCLFVCLRLLCMYISLHRSTCFNFSPFSFPSPTCPSPSPPSLPLLSSLQLTLLRFLHTCCDVLQSGRVSPSLFLAFLHLLKGLANTPSAANCCYTFLCPTGSRGFSATEGQKPGGVVSWDHFFQSMKQYYLGLRQVSVFIGPVACVCVLQCRCWTSCILR